MVGCCQYCVVISYSADTTLSRASHYHSCCPRQIPNVWTGEGNLLGQGRFLIWFKELTVSSTCQQ
jgi:hypothetical protein